MSYLFVYGVLECGCKNSQFHRRKCPLRHYMGNDSGFRNETLCVKIGRFKLNEDQLVSNTFQGFDSCHLNVFPPFKKDKVTGRCFVDVSLSQEGVSQVSQITSLVSSQLASPFVETKRLCLFHEVLPLTNRLNKKFDSFPLQLARIEIYKSLEFLRTGGMADGKGAAAAEVIIPCRRDDSSQARMEREAKCKEQTKLTTTTFKYCCCTFLLLLGALILIPIVATEILNRQKATVVNGS